MKDQSYRDLAKKLGLGKSTVSRTVRHCPGVDGRTRQRVLEEALRTGIGDAAEPCSIYCIVPDTPGYFWHIFHDRMREELKHIPFSVKYNVYSHLLDHETVLLYLDEAVRCGARVVILSADLSPAIKERLAAMQNGGVYVILLSVYGELPNSVYVGADPYQDGEEIGLWLWKHYPRYTPVILNSSTRHASARIRGFLHVLERYHPDCGDAYSIVDVRAEDFSNPKLLPSRFASLFSRVERGYSCIYMPFGNFHLPPSLLKVGMKSDIPVLLSHDCFTEAGPDTLYPGYTASCNQDIARQVGTAMETAAAYLRDPFLPDGQTFRYIPSKICCRAQEASD